MDDISNSELPDNQSMMTIDINQAPLESITKLNGIDRSLAIRIIENRPFNNIEDLLNVQGIDEHILEEIKPNLTLSLSHEQQLVDINQAAVDELVKVPGIGNVLAQRIIEHRPYTSIDDLSHLQGISSSLLEQIRPRLTLSTTTTVDHRLPSSIQTRKTSEVIAVPTRSTTPPIIELPSNTGDEQPSNASKSPAGSEKLSSQDGSNRQLVPYHSTASTEEEDSTQSYSKDRSDKGLNTYAMMAVTSLISIILSILLTLGVLAIINSSLFYTPAKQFEELRRNVETIETQVEVLSQDIDNLRTRLDSLETVSGRVSKLEKSTDNIKNNLDEISGDVDILFEDYNNLAKQTAEMKSSISLFNTFLEQLRTVLVDLLSPLP